MQETPQTKTDVQTLLEYFDKLLGTFKALIWIASIAIAIVTAIFTAMLFEDKNEAQAKVIEAEGKAERAFAKADSLIKNASNSIDETEADAKQGIASVSEVAEKEISNLKSIARQRASEEVDRFVKSPEIQSLIDSRVRKEIEDSYFKDVSEMSEVTSAATQMLIGEYGGMLKLQKYSLTSKNHLSQQFALEQLKQNCEMIMKTVWVNFPDYSDYPESYKQRIKEDGFDTKILEEINDILSWKLPKLNQIAHRINLINIKHGKAYTICDLKEVNDFLNKKSN